MSIQPLNSSNSYSTNLNQMNIAIRQLNNEQTVKTFKQASGNAIVTGKLPYDGGYGTLYYDSDGSSRIVIGIAPDGEIDIGVSKAGFNITEQY